ncbi:MAG: hypothetical protein R3A46_01855 [Thermomicrobiales bacterium]
MSQWSRRSDDDVPPEVVAAIIAAIRAVTAGEPESGVVSRWLRRNRRHIADWGDQPESWLDRVRLRAVQRDR